MINKLGLDKTREQLICDRNDPVLLCLTYFLTQYVAESIRFLVLRTHQLV